MRNTVQFLGQTFTHARIARLEATLDTDLSYRSLDVDTALVSLSTEDRRTPLLFFTAEPLPFFTRDSLRFNTAPTGEAPPAIGAWSRADALQILRGGSLLKTFYPESLRRVSPYRTEVTLTSALGVLAQLSHKGGVYTGATGANPMTAGALIREICGYSGSTPGPVTVYVAPEFESIAVYGWLPYVTPSGVAGSQLGSAKDNLLQVLFAINASLRASTDGGLRVENLSTVSQSTISRDRVYRENAAVEELAPVTRVTLLEHQYFPGTETETLFDGVTTEGQLIVFSEPMTNLTATGFTITESGANYAVVSAGSGTLTGSPYIHVTREITRTLAASGPDNEMRVEDATLVGVTAGADVANRLAAFYACRKYITCDATLASEDAGDVVSIWDPIDRVMRAACLESIAPLTLSNTAKGRLRALVGFTPWQTVPFEDRRVLLTGSGTWTVPAGVTYVTAILIGSGGGGNGGQNGANGTRYTYNASVSVPFTAGVPNGVGGAGGKGGTAGVAGKVLRLDLTVTPGQALAYACGAAGAAGAANGGAGGAGGDTTFGAYSSASGSMSESGFYDAASQITFALPGTNGTDGAAGGDGGTATQSGMNGKNGGNSATHTGGTGGTGVYTSHQGTQTSNTWTGYFGGGGGGGAGSGNGSNGKNGAGMANGVVYGGGGGNGADGLPATGAPSYGSAGNGGNGGGGGGGCGGWTYSESGNLHYSGQVTYYPTIGAGGIGTAGTAGGAGCIILYYREPA